jgi:hypothetical protein
MRNAYKNLIGIPEQKIRFGRPRPGLDDIDEMRCSGKKCGNCGLKCSGFALVSVEGSCEHGNDTSVSVKCRTLLD